MCNVNVTLTVIKHVHRLSGDPAQLTQQSASRLFVDCALKCDTEVTLTPEQSHYVHRVLRLNVADNVTLFNGTGGEFTATLVAVAKRGVDVRIDEHSRREVESPLAIQLVQGISRSDRMDTIVQKATELGIRRLTPVLTEFSVVRLDAAKRDKRALHWTRIAQSACEQCGRNVPPIIDTPLPIAEWSDNLPKDAHTRILLHPSAAASLSSLEPSGDAVVLLIGPEGGLSQSEISAASASGFESCSLGPRILRTETAAIAAVALLQARWGDLA